MIKVIAFDLDDTLWHVDPVIRRAETKLIGWLESTIPGYRYNPKNMLAIRETLLSEDPSLAHRLTAFRQQLIERSLVHHQLSTEHAAELAGSAMEVFLDARNQVEFFDGTLDTIIDIARQFQLGALTNGNADIHRLGLGGHFSFAFSAEQVGAPKPAPDLFHAALDHTGCQPDEMVYVGDDPIKDVDAANQVGLHTIWMNPRNEQSRGTSSPDQIISMITELPEAIRLLTAG